MTEKFHILAILAVSILLIGTSTYIYADTQLDQQNQGQVKMLTDKDFYKCDEKVIVTISGSPNTTYLLVIKDPNGNVQQVKITTDSSGIATYTYIQTGPSGVWLLELYDERGRLVAEWKYRVECKEQPQPGNSCLAVVSDLQTFVDRGNTVAVSYFWPSPINSNNLGIPGATPIWSSNGLDTGNAYTFTKHFILPQGYAYSASIMINADDIWDDLRINGNLIANTPAGDGWGNVHTFSIPSAFLHPGLNTLTVKAKDIGQAVAAVAFKMDVYCKPAPSSIHWDKIVFTINVQQNVGPANKVVGPVPVEPKDELMVKLRPLLGKTLDIKVRDNPADVVALEDVVKSFLAAKYNLTKPETDRIIVKIVEVEYAIDTNAHYMAKPQKPEQTGSSTKGNTLNNSYEGIYYALPFVGIGTVVALWYKRRRGY